MGDCGYKDSAGAIWFCGRKVERVETAQGTLFTEPCEQVFRSHAHVERCALVGLGPRGAQTPALVVQLRKQAGRPTASENVVAAELRERARTHIHTAGITKFFFHPNFPVDVRHNAKIHRLTLARWAATQKPVLVS
jgi:acyl-coenzyme A synthetase/AMP-(fatty) acid ligase